MKISQMDNKICCVFNVGALYRAPIYQLMDRSLGCDFFIGDDQGIPLKKMDYETIEGFMTTLHNVRIGPFTWRKGYTAVCKKEYKTYIMTGEPNCITDWIILLWARLNNKRTLLWCHGWYGKETLFAKIIKKCQFRLSSGLLLYGNRAKKLLLKEGVKKEKLYVIHNSLDYSKQIEIRKSLQPSKLFQEHFNNNNKNIVFIGRLTKVKRFDLLLEAISILKNRGEYINVTFIGDGVERQNMEMMVLKHGLQHLVWFYGACYDELLNAEMIFNADLCVSPGNIGLTAIHVLMFGCPAITNDDFAHQMPEFEAIHEGKTGAFFRAGDSTSLADAISDWFLRHENDRDDVRNMCYQEIDSSWNPNYQLSVINKAVTAE